MQEQKGFKVDDMGRWLLHHNPYLMEHYSGSKSKTGESRILDSIRNTIKRYLEHLEKWWIVSKEDVDAKNGIKTGLYSYGRVGLIIARILEYRHSLDKSDDGGRQEVKNEIFGLIQRRFKDPRAYNSYKEEFLAEFYRKLIEYDYDQPGLCDSLIIQIISIFEDESITYDKAIHYLDHVLQTIPLTPSGVLHTKQPILRNLYLQILDQLPEDTRRKVMDHDKNLFESKMLTSSTAPPKD